MSLPTRSNRKNGRWLFLLLLAANTTPSLDAGEEWRPREQALARLLMARAAALKRDYPDSLEIRARIQSEQAALRVTLQTLAGKQPPLTQTGLRLEAYHSANDDSVQPFLRYLPADYAPTSTPPLIVFLHGYNPMIGLVDGLYIPAELASLADTCAACVAAPFGRSNTDYQGIGEQDVIRVIEEMQARYHADPRRVVLVGYSMGGLGAWCIGARHPERFNGVLVISGRGDFYTWHQLKPTDLPPWQRRLVDMQFAAAWLSAVTNLPILAWHGGQDPLVPLKEGRAIIELARTRNHQVALLTVPLGDHSILGEVLVHPRTTAWLRDALMHAKPRNQPTGRRVGETGSRLQDAFLQPFLFVGGRSTNHAAAAHVLKSRAEEWHRFSRNNPRTSHEVGLDTNLAATCHLFVFGEPENSPLIRQVLQNAGVEITPAEFRIAGRSLPRTDHGLWFTGRNPFNPQLCGIVQCGLPWGEGLSDNHRYDRIPDVIAYERKADRWGGNLAVAAGYLDALHHVQWYDPPVTPAILPPVNIHGP